MSDLYIEARLQAIKDIASASCVDIKDADNISSFCDEIYSAIPKIDNVVEELEKEAEIWEDSGKEYKDKCEIAVGRGLRNAIEIVKQGGVSDDVCEWISVSDGELIQNPHTKGLFSNESSMKNIYCNTCGKKIKVVE